MALPVVAYLNNRMITNPIINVTTNKVAIMFVNVYMYGEMICKKKKKIQMTILFTNLMCFSNVAKFVTRIFEIVKFLLLVCHSIIIINHYILI